MENWGMDTDDIIAYYCQYQLIMLDADVSPFTTIENIGDRHSIISNFQNMIFSFTLLLFPLHSEPYSPSVQRSHRGSASAEISEKPDMILLEVEVLKAERQGGGGQQSASADWDDGAPVRAKKGWQMTITYQ